MTADWLLLTSWQWHIFFIITLQGVELGPLEIQINSLQKSIEAEQQEIVDLKQMWLRDQNELVALSKENDRQNISVLNLKKQITILSQKKLRIEGRLRRCIQNITKLQLKWWSQNNLLPDHIGHTNYITNVAIITIIRGRQLCVTSANVLFDTRTEYKFTVVFMQNKL